MDDGRLISLLNPSIAFILAVAFSVLWRYQPQRRYLVALAIGYSCSGTGFLLQAFELPIGFAATKFLSSLAFASCAFFIAGAISRRYGRPVPYAGLALLCGGGLAAFSWFLFVEDSLTWRILSMNFALGGVTLVVAAELRAVSDKTPVGRLLLIASILGSINFFGRTLLFVVAAGGYESYEGFYSSAYWITVLLSNAVISLTVALCLFAGAAIDMYRSLRAESHTDALSGLLNRRGFEERAKLLVGERQDDPKPISLVLIDIDHFKAVNDLHGHGTGDAVIAAFSRLLAQAGPSEALIGRIGGEEFAVLLPRCDIASARLFAEGVRTMVANGRLEGVPDSVGRITASFGVGSINPNERLHNFMGRVDESLYQAKRAGRDCVKVTSPTVQLQPTAVMPGGRPADLRDWK